MSTPTTDADLLVRFLEEGSQAAFAELVRTHEGLVVGTAYRRTGDLEMARDVAQQVFALLARKAAWLAGRESVAGWLHHAASFLAARARRSEARLRARHEAMEETEGGGERRNWEVIEEALASLRGPDREALVLHYFEDRGYAEMASGLGISEAAARQRVSRALRHLGGELRQRGVAVPAATLLAGAAAVQSTATAQAGLAAAALAGSTASAPVALTLTTIMSHTASKIAATALLLSAVPAALSYRENTRLRSTSPPPPAVVASANVSTSPASADPSLVALNRQIAETWEQLRTEQTARLQAEEKVARLTDQIRRAEEEVMISYGQVEDLAKSLVPMLRQWINFSELKEKVSPEDRAKLAKEIAKGMQNFGDVMLVGREAQKLEADPKKAGRFLGTLIGELAELAPAERDALSEAAARQYAIMKTAGLTLPPEPDRQDKAWWESRRKAFSDLRTEAMRVMPEGKRRAVDLVWDNFDLDTVAFPFMKTSDDEKK